jgi:hypothetical protein
MKAAAALSLVASLLGAMDAGAVTTAPSRAADGMPRPARTRVRVGVAGSLTPEQQANFLELIGVEMASTGLSLEVSETQRSIDAFVRDARADDTTLLIAVLDARKTSEWHVLIVDPDRDRAITRPLPGGIDRNAAALEAVASIVVSAASALKEGLEVASLPLESVVAPEPHPASAPRAPQAHAGERKRPPESDSTIRASADRPLRLSGGVAASVASFDRDVPVTLGAQVAGALRTPPGLSVRLSVERHLPARFDSTLGTFDLTRSGGAFSVGWLVPLGPLALEPDAGVAAEWIHRSDTRADPEFGARADGTEARVGARAGGRTLLPLVGAAALSGSLQVTYFPQVIRFVGGGAPRASVAEPWPLVLAAHVGVELSPGSF